MDKSREYTIVGNSVVNDRQDWSVAEFVMRTIVACLQQADNIVGSIVDDVRCTCERMGIAVKRSAPETTDHEDVIDIVMMADDASMDMAQVICRHAELASRNVVIAATQECSERAYEIVRSISGQLMWTVVVVPEGSVGQTLSTCVAHVRSVNTRVAVTFSGGGFRATLFHLGVLKSLRDLGLLKNSVALTAVSGGSILAAHAAINWSRYCGSDHEFDGVCAEIVNFTLAGVRERIQRGMFLRPIRGDATARLSRDYRYLFNDETLASLSTCDGPDVHLLCSNLTMPSAICSFWRDGYILSNASRKDHVQTTQVLIRDAVAISSAFPAMFPPKRVTAKFLGVNEDAFQAPWQELTDGGVVDNLGTFGLRMFVEEESYDHVVVSDASAMMDWNWSSAIRSLSIRLLRANAVAMSRVHDLELNQVKTSRNFTVVDIRDVIAEQFICNVMNSDAHRHVANVRTDLDRFSAKLIFAIMKHGYAIGHQTVVEACEQSKFGNAWSVQNLKFDDSWNPLLGSNSKCVVDTIVGEDVEMESKRRVLKMW